MSELLILGGGPAGLAVATHAHWRGIPFRLHEATSRFGGLCRTLEWEGHRYDTGAHRFHDRDPEVTADVESLLGRELRPVTAPSWIHDDGRTVPFPPTLGSVLSTTGVLGLAGLGRDLIRGRFARHPATSFRELAIRRYGRRLAERYLFPYSAKLWGRPAEQLSVDVATRRLEGATVGSWIADLLMPGRRPHHLDGDFLYPARGYGSIVEALIGALPPESLRLRQRVEAIRVEGQVVKEVVFASGERVEPGARVISTIPLPALVTAMGSAVSDRAREGARALRYRDVRLVYLRLSCRAVSEAATIYFPDPGLVMTRASEPRNRSRLLAPPGETGLLVEVPCEPGDGVHGLDDAALSRRVIADLASTGLVDARVVLGSRHHHLRQAYPVYDQNYEARLRVVMAEVEPLVIVAGRNGRFWYSHLHDQLRGARELVQQLSPDLATAAQVCKNYQEARSK